jgi:NAD+ kinase
MHQIETVGIISKPGIPQAVHIVTGLLQWLDGKKIAYRCDEQTAEYGGLSQSFPRENLADGSDLIIVLGGDGTLLSAARFIAGHDVPLFAVNLGRLGFLTAIRVEDLYSELERALIGGHRIGRRRMVDCEIVATPTGSTAYSLSAGGPVIFPSVHAFCLTPICPHMLTNRPVIVPDTSIINILVHGEDGTYLTIDGQVGEPLSKGDVVVCRSSPKVIQLIRPPRALFFDVLREKLKWGER